MTARFVIIWELQRTECVPVDYAELVYISYTFTACRLQPLPPAATPLDYVQINYSGFHPYQGDAACPASFGVQ
jgi:hypothetical protein